MKKELSILKPLEIVSKCINSVIFPMSCCVCGDYSNDAVCNKCWSEVIMITEHACKKCDKPFYNPYLISEEGDYICEDCQEKAIFFERAFSYGVYRDTLMKIIHAFKFHNKPYISKYLARKLLILIESNEEFKEIDLIIPVPMYWKKEIERGYNQSYLLAKQLSKLKKIKLEKGVLVKVKNTGSQSLMPMKSRKQNVKGSFFVKRSEKIRNKIILLIDDVYTTGSTVNECARMLRLAGAGKIIVLTIARTA
jgi:ComF family protein